ncbi:zinc protease [Porphyrobacter sp. MBR-155]|uniref:M16 family metallopeptidase n=1 Tax=Porphyrobacter sp. MBR-155 TaxID=3156464 RepID=UPI003399AD9A
MGRTAKGSVRAVSCLAIAVGLVLSGAPAALAQEHGEQPAATAQAPATGVPAWGIASTDFPADPDIVFGTLPNGMRYALRRNGNPPGEAVIRFSVAVGGKEETDAENGAAHFVEHMAFNGSTNIPEGQLLPMLERLGLAFGPDTNAVTSLEYTTYMLNLPRTNGETVDAALTVIRDMAGELTIDPAAVERERGVVMSEAQIRNDPARRRITDYLQTALPDSRLGFRVRADVERIRTISADELRAFYQAYYRPERATLVIVGDFDPAAMRSKIETVFSDWQGKGEARPRYASPVPEVVGAPAVGTFVDPATPEIIDLQRISPWVPSSNTAAEAREEVLRAVAAAALSNRIAVLSRNADSPTLGAQAADQPLFRSARSYGMLIVAKDGRWQDTLALAEQELRRAQQFGFTAAELEEAKANIATALANAAAQAAGRPSSRIADALVAASLDNIVPTAPATDLAFYQAIAPTITPESVSAAFRAAWQGGPTVVHVSTKQLIEGGKTAILTALEDSAKVAITAPVEAAAATFAYQGWGAPGVVVSDSTIADLGIRTVRFANGLELNLKVTAFEPGKVAFAMRVGDGARDFPIDKPGLREILPFIVSIDGLVAHDADELRRVLAGKAVSTGLAAGQDALQANGTTTPADLEMQLNLLAARLTATGWRPETQAQWAGVAPVIVQNIRANPLQLFSVALNAALTGGDARFGLVNPESLAQLSLDDVRAAVAPQLDKGSIALGLVGDFDPDAAIAAVARTLGTLPTRPARKEAKAGGKPVTFVRDPAVVVLNHAGASDQGVLALSWQTDDAADQRDDITRDLLAAVMQLRLQDKLREELGATYSPVATSYSELRFEGLGHLTAYTTVSPEAMDATAAAIRAIAAELVEGPAPDDLIERARNPMRDSYKRAESQNLDWTGPVVMAQSDPRVLDQRRTRTGILEALTAADLQTAARRYLAGAGAVEIRVVPAGS